MEKFSRPIKEYEIDQLDEKLKYIFGLFKRLFGEDKCSSATHFLFHSPTIVR